MKKHSLWTTAYRTKSAHGRHSLLLLLILMALLLAGCGKKAGKVPPEGQKAYDIYYLNLEDTHITKETVYLQDGLPAIDVLGLLQKQLEQMPENTTLKASVGNAYNINHSALKDGRLIVDVDEGYQKLSPAQEILNRAALVRTLAQVDGVQTVMITVAGGNLTDNSGNMIGPMTVDAFIDNAGQEINSYERTTLQLYFADESGERLVKVSRNVVYNSNINMEKLVVENLISGPKDTTSGVYPVLNKDTKVISATLKDGTCYLNLDSGFLTPMAGVNPEITLYSVVNSLCELSGVTKVQISVDGETNIMFREIYNLDNVYERNLDLIRE